MSKVPVFVFGIILAILGLIIFASNSNASGPEGMRNCIGRLEAVCCHYLEY